MWRLRIDHVTTYEYSSPARASYNEVRQTPPTTSRQTALETRIQTTPGASQYSYRDYWGTRVVAFNVDGPHEQLTVHSTALVETRPWSGRTDATWKDVDLISPRHAEYLTPSHYTDSDGELAELGRSLRRASPLATTEHVVGWVHDTLDYVRGVTHVHTSAREAYAARSGVCQDFAHLALTVLRAAGLPVRYVSGYIHHDEDAAIGEEIAGESHAWIEAWLGDWWGIDPTNDGATGLRHVVVARGRDYADVPPVRGIYAGDAEHSARVNVNMTRTS
jgi:transglutaminase-like putative cysteine protease